MALDMNQPPTNKLLLECGPEGTRKLPPEQLLIPVREPVHQTPRPSWYLLLLMWKDGRRGVNLGYSTSNMLSLGHVTTLGQVISLYELLSQKKWPGA